MGLINLLLILFVSSLSGLVFGVGLKPRQHSEIEIDLTSVPKFKLDGMGFELDLRTRYTGTYRGVHSFSEIKVLDNNHVPYKVIPSQIYSKIELDLGSSGVSPALLHKLDFSLDHPNPIENIYRGTHSEKEIRILSESNIPFKILTHDYAKSYSERWLRLQESNPRALRKKNQRSPGSR